MSLRHRIERLEREAPEPPARNEVVVRRRIVRPTPDGPMTVRVITTRYVDGKPVERTEE
jgi:hypothetical protein